MGEQANVSVILKKKKKLMASYRVDLISIGTTKPYRSLTSDWSYLSLQINQANNLACLYLLVLIQVDSNQLHCIGPFNTSLIAHLNLVNPISSACSLKVLLDMLIPYFLMRPWHDAVTLQPLESFPNFLGWL